MESKVHRKCSSLILVIVLCMPLSLLAQTPDSMKTYHLDPVVVTATHAEALRSSLPNAFTVIPRGVLEQSGSTALLSVLNHEVPGMFVTERGILGYGVANGAAGQITMRGTGGNPTTGVLILTDGRPQMMGLMGHPLPDAYSVAGVERVEVIRGPASLLYGSNAMGGVVNVIPQSAYGQALHGEASALYGSYGTRKLDLDGSFGFEPGALQVSFGREETDGHRNWSSFRMTTGSVRGAIPLNAQFSLTPDLAITDFRTYDPGPASKPYVNNWVDATRGSGGLTLRNSFSNSEGAVKLFANWGRHDIYDGFHSTDQFLGAMLYQAFRLTDAATVTAGADFHRYGGAAENRISSLSYGDHRITESAAYIVAKVDSLGPVSVTAGLRYNYHSLYKGEVVPQAGISWKALEGTTVRANAGKGFRSPTIRELYLFPAPTPTLEPERMWNYEVGLLQALGHFASVDVAAFLAEGSNMILVGGAYPKLTLSNSGHFTHRGIETSLQVAPTSALSFKLAYSYLDPSEQTNANPRHKADGMLTWQVSPVEASAGVQWVSGLYGADFHAKPLPEYTLVRARVCYKVIQGFSVFISGENLLNRSYQIIYDYPMPGRTVFAGIKWVG
jgi:outer membrane cobalamin receptor